MIPFLYSSTPIIQHPTTPAYSQPGQNTEQHSGQDCVQNSGNMIKLIYAEGGFIAGGYWWNCRRCWLGQWGPALPWFAPAGPRSCLRILPSFCRAFPFLSISFYWSFRSTCRFWPAPTPEFDAGPGWVCLGVPPTGPTQGNEAAPGYDVA